MEIAFFATLALVAVVMIWRTATEMRREERRRQQMMEAMQRPTAYGHPFDPVAELKKELPSPPPGHMWELTVDRNPEFCHIMTLGLLHTATGKVLASKSANLTKNGNQEWRALYGGPAARSGVEDWARGVIVGQTVEWARRQKEIHTPPDGPSHHEVIA